MAVVDILSVLTLLGDVLALLLIVLLILRNRLRGAWIFVKRNALLFSFIVAAISVSGSLYLSEVAHYVPCELCWFQRIMMYPQLLIFAVALVAKTHDYRKYSIAMSIVGGVIALYHYSTQLLSAPSICTINETSCSSHPFIAFGYITIPMMALTAFLLLILLNVGSRKSTV